MKTRPEADGQGLKRTRLRYLMLGLGSRTAAIVCARPPVDIATCMKRLTVALRTRHRPCPHADQVTSRMT